MIADTESAIDEFFDLHFQKAKAREEKRQRDAKSKETLRSQELRNDLVDSLVGSPVSFSPGASRAVSPSDRGSKA